MEHYTKEELDQYRNGGMSVLRKISCAAHLKNCKACAKLLKELEAEEKKFSAEIDRLTVNRNSIRENMKRMKEHLKETMIVIGKPKFSSEHFKFSVAKNGGLQPLSLAPIDMIPDEYIIMEPKADTDRIRRDLNDGVELSFAHLEERGTHLNIR